MLQIQALLHQLAEWSPQAADADRVVTILLGMLNQDTQIPIALAPAHPDEMRTWLVKTISARAAATVQSSASVLTVQFDSFLNVLPLVLRNTVVTDWPIMLADLRHCRGEILFSNDIADTIDALLVDRNIQRFLRTFSGFHLAPSGYGRQRAHLSVQANWRWPLSIAVDDDLLVDPEVRRVNHILRRLGLAQLVSKNEAPEAAIYLVTGDSATVLSELGNQDKERYAYIVGTGFSRKTSDLKKITNKARSAGAVMLGWKPDAIVRNLVLLLKNITRDANRDDTLEAWIRQLGDGAFAICYAHTKALDLTAPRNAMLLLRTSLIRRYGASGASNLLSARAMQLDPRHPLNLLFDWPSIEMPVDRKAANSWLRSVGRFAKLLQCARECTL